MYWSAGDEAAFFAWLQSIPGVESVTGEGSELHIKLRSSRLSQPALRELIALYARYGGDMRELARFETVSNSTWFRSPISYWYEGVFGVDSRTRERKSKGK
jgi:hypothetical protein